MTNEFLIKHTIKSNVEKAIKGCQKEGHIQQVAFSTYHHALTQICFTCREIWTSLKEEDLMTNEEINAREHGEIGNN